MNLVGWYNRNRCGSLSCWHLYLFPLFGLQTCIADKGFSLAFLRVRVCECEAKAPGVLAYRHASYWRPRILAPRRRHVCHPANVEEKEEVKNRIGIGASSEAEKLESKANPNTV
ncbi:hypothetical protein BofuT4_P054300.1 [Botrytis cinerea T4]|uniref:Uncharacterized protein n=1 Tax=Botryotinia fuckeliana (strain T4) TaxID=999810 RepID=G2XVK9_BOTF4|nr:hypothetical protein BofuT4_P054300.1 [Botrytis cinerea T4]